MRRTPLCALLALLLPLAGCIEVPRDDALGASFTPPAPPSERIQGMTAEETREDAVARCDRNNVQVPPAAYCATRTLTVKGRIGVDQLPVTLEGRNGAVVLQDNGGGDAWSLVAIVKVRALTEEDAREALDAAWSWSHEDGSGHHLKAGPTPGALLLGAPAVASPALVGAQYLVTLPGWVRLDLDARTDNGAIALDWGEAGSVRAQTTNGAIALHGIADDVTARTSNGAIQADLLPRRGGAWTLDTSNGAIHLDAAESPARGYDLDARTTNGRIEILLHDGHLQKEGRDRATFKTSGFEQRDVKTTVSLGTSNGAIVVTG